MDDDWQSTLAAYFWREFFFFAFFRYSQVYSTSDKDLEELRRSYKTRMNSNGSCTSDVSDNASVASGSTNRSEGDEGKAATARNNAPDEDSTPVCESGDWSGNTTDEGDSGSSSGTLIRPPRLPTFSISVEESTGNFSGQQTQSW